ncbi:MAG: CDP-alcohol phosphatidyltransferase family protein [Alphaproteobacteria bacterium]
MNLTTELHNSWTHKLARSAVRPLVGSWVTPNHLTTGRLLFGIAACAALAMGERRFEIWGGGLWIMSAFLDRADGELARLGGKITPGGHSYDYFCDVLVNALFFVAVGFALRDGTLGLWAPVMGIAAGASIAAASVLSETLEKRDGSGDKAYVGIAGFDFDDALYLLGPLAWLDWLAPVLVGAAVASPAIAALTYVRLRRHG